MIEDKLLIYRCKQGSRTAFRRIYEKYQGELRNLAANLLNDKTMAEDVVHDVFISFLGVLDTFDLRSNLKGYLKTSVANKARDFWRKKRPQSFNVDDTELAALDENEPVQWAVRNELAQKLDAAMKHLPYEQKEAVVLYTHGAMKFKAIAELQGVSIKTAYTRHRAGLDKLKLILNSEFEE